MTTTSSAPKTWADGETLTFTDFNAQIRDYLLALCGPGNTYTPTLSQGSATDIGKTVTYSKYWRAYKDVRWQFNLAVNTNGGGSGDIELTIPVTAATGSGLVIGQGTYYNQDGTNYPVLIRLASTTKIEFVRADTTTDSAVGTSPAIECSDGDYIKGSVRYEAA